MGWTLLGILCAISLTGCQSGNASGTTRGKELYSTCAPCHGPSGAGKREVGAPGIAGMNSWYVEQELHKFESGARGTNFEDAEGMHMQPMSLTLRSAEDVKAVSEYVASLPRTRPAPTIIGDVTAGQGLYATCIACHGASGEGNPTLKAPRLADMDDWYLAAELKKFKNGIRGTNPEDQEGELMHTMTATLGDDKAIRDVVAYIDTFKP